MSEELEKVEDIEQLQGEVIKDINRVTAGILIEFEDGSKVKFEDRSGIGIGLSWRE